MNTNVSKPWVLALLALIMLLVTQAVALKLYWDDLFPSPSVLVVTRDDPSPIHWSFNAEEISMLQRELKKRVRELEEKETGLREFEARLLAERAEVQEIKATVERNRQRLFEDIIELEEAERENLKTLAKTYANLQPAATVRIFRELDDPTVVKILFFMRPEMVGNILEAMAAQGGEEAESVRRAARLSNMLRLFTDTNDQPQRNI